MPMMAISQLSDLTGMTRNTVKKRLESLTPEHGPKRALLYEPKKALPLLYAPLIDGDRLDLSTERAKLTIEQTAINQLKRLEMERQLVHIDDVRKDWLAHIAVAKGRLLAMPSRLAPELAATSTMRRVEDLLRGAIHDVLEEIQNDIAAEQN
jgi:hypothetical protein